MQAELSGARQAVREAQDTAASAIREASALRQERDQLESELRSARASAAAAGTSGRGAAGAEEGAAATARLQTALREEQAKRRQAEKDFLELMTSIEEGAGGGPGGGGGGVASRRLQELQGKVEALEGEKAALEDNVGKTRALMAAMQVGRHAGRSLSPS